MRDGRPSATALTAAVMRAHHYLFTHEPRVLTDHLAMPLASMTSQTEVSAYIDGMVGRLAEFGDRGAAEMAVRDGMMCVCARSRIVEDELAASLARGMRQLIILGAGLDSTAYRRTDITDRLQIFEVDYPATQAWKRERLMAGGVRTAHMSIFTWMGVQSYLTRDAVMSTLDVVARFPSGSELALDLMTPTDSRQSEGMTEGVLATAWLHPNQYGRISRLVRSPRGAIRRPVFHQHWSMCPGHGPGGVVIPVIMPSLDAHTNRYDEPAARNGIAPNTTPGYARLRHIAASVAAASIGRIPSYPEVSWMAFS